MRYYDADNATYVATLQLSYEQLAMDRPERFIIDVTSAARRLRDSFHAIVRPLTDQILFRRAGCFPVVDLTTHPDRYVHYRHDIDPFDDQVKELPYLKSVNVSDDILDLHTRRVIPFRQLQQLTSNPEYPIQEYQLINRYVENHLQQRLPLHHVRKNRWRWTDYAICDYLRPDVLTAREEEHRRQLLSDCHEEIQFYLSDVLCRIDDAIQRHTEWMVYHVSGSVGDLRIEARGDYRVFAWMQVNSQNNRETQSTE